METINEDTLDRVTGGQSRADLVAACAIGSHEAGRQMEAKRGWFSRKPTPQAIYDNSLSGCRAGMEALLRQSATR